jgi:hypothetical protein
VTRVRDKVFLFDRKMYDECLQRRLSTGTLSLPNDVDSG